MARSEARLKFGIWRSGLDGLSKDAKLMYAVLLTEPTLNHCGVGAVRLSRWARDASMSLEETEKALSELADSQHVLIDEDTEEVFVRSFMRNDEVEKQPYVLKGALREAVQASSPAIRLSIAGELRKMAPRRADGVSKLGGKVTYPDPHATADILDPPPAPKPTPKGSETLFDSERPSEGATPSVDGEKGFERVSSGTHEKGLESLGGGGGGGGVVTSVGTSVGRAAKNRGTRIPEDFAPTLAMIKWAKERAPHVNGRLETEKFINYWTAKSGQSATKVDWVATWRNWFLEAEERTARPGRSSAFDDQDPAVTGKRRTQLS